MPALITIIMQRVRRGIGQISLPPLSAPRNLRFTGYSRQHLGQINLAFAWDAPTDFGEGATAVSYETQQRPVGGLWSTTFTQTGTTRTIAVVESNTTRYEFRVRAVNNAPTPQRSDWVISAPVLANENAPVTTRSMEWAGRQMEWATRTQNWGS